MSEFYSYRLPWKLNVDEVRAFHIYERNRALIMDRNGDEDVLMLLGFDPGIRVSKCDPLDDYDTAEEYLRDAHFPGTLAMAVPYKTKIQIPASDKCEALLNASNDAYDKVKELKNKFYQEMKEAKSTTIKCKSCECILKRSYLKSMECPICNEAFYSTTYKKRLQSAIDKSDKKWNDYVAKAGSMKIDGIGYLIGGYSNFKKNI